MAVIVRRAEPPPPCEALLCRRTPLLRAAFQVLHLTNVGNPCDTGSVTQPTRPAAKAEKHWSYPSF